MDVTDERVWYHCTCHTYAAWLYGDTRGYRTRHHREHVEGDYKNPPAPGQYASQLKRSLGLLKQPPVRIQQDYREIVGFGMVAKLRQYTAHVLALSVSSNHVHILAKMRMNEIPRLWVGYAKREAIFRLKAIGWKGKLWGKRSGISAIKDREHQLSTFHYILRHQNEGAWIWDFREHPDT